MFITFVVIEKDIEFGGSIALLFKFLGEIFGIIAGAVGIYLSRSKNDKDMKCLWKGYITLVCWIFKNFSFTAILSVQCVFTTVSSSIGFIANVIALHLSYLQRNSELSLVQILTVETFLFFGKT